MSSFSRPLRSPPNKNAASVPARIRRAASKPASRTDSGDSPSARRRAVKPKTHPAPSRAPSKLSCTSMSPKMSAAPAAIARDCESSSVRGAASIRRVKPIVFIARAAAPMFPG